MASSVVPPTIADDRVHFCEIGDPDDLGGLVRVYGATLRDPARSSLESVVGRRLAERLLGPAAEAMA